MMLFSEHEMRGYWPFGDLPAGAFDLIMADPPWRFELYSASGEEKSAQSHYDCMSLDDIARLPVAGLAAPDCVLWLWATAPMLPQQIAIAERWGFEVKTQGVWVKTTVNGKLAFGTGYLLRNAHEPFLIATRGNPKTSRSIRSVIMAEAREHSRKPDAAFHAAEQMIGARGADGQWASGAPKKMIELFSRQHRPGWATWGNEQGKFSNAA